jgi:hypothetical protein
MERRMEDICEDCGMLDDECICADDEPEDDEPEDDEPEDDE